MSLQHLKTNPFRLSAEVNAVWNPPYPRMAGEGYVIAEFPPGEKAGIRHMELGWKHLVGDLPELTADAWNNLPPDLIEGVGMDLLFSQDPNYVEGFALFTPEFRPLHCTLEGGNGPLPATQQEEIFRRLLAALKSPQRVRVRRRLLLSQGEQALVQGFVEEFYERKTDQDRETDFDAVRKHQLENLGFEILHCEWMLGLFDEQVAAAQP